MSRASLARVVAVFLVSAVLLGYGAASVRLGDGYLDPVGRITAQDEAVYSHAAIRMAATGDWATPYFLGRFFLYKPPLVYWLSGVSARLFGVSARALRLPAVLACAGVAAIVFHWVARDAGAVRGLMAALLLLLCPLWQTMARRNLTDAPLCLGIALFCWLLASGGGAWAMAACVAWCLLAKSTAGLIPLMILGAWWWVGRPPLSRATAIAGGAFALAAPWFVYQWWAHPRWFLAEFVGVELLAFGAGAPPQTSAESTPAFYATRLYWGAAPLLAPVLFALPRWIAALRARAADAWLIACWAGVMLAAIAGYQYRNATYLLPLLPPLAIAAARWAHPLSMAPLLPLLLLLGPAYPDVESTPARMAETYAALDRRNELIVVGADDNFYAATLPGIAGKLRYALPGTGQPGKGFALDFARMGVAVSVGDFNNPGALDIYRPRLREWGLPDTSALATVIAWPDAAALATLIRANPGRDFLVPATAPEPPSDSGHLIRRDTHGNRLLLAP